jgi:hypothetical protein
MMWSKVALFLSGLFFGEAIDHVTLALISSEYTPYDVHSGVRGNWVFALLDEGQLCFSIFCTTSLGGGGSAMGTQGRAPAATCGRDRRTLGLAPFVTLRRHGGHLPTGLGAAAAGIRTGFHVRITAELIAVLCAVVAHLRADRADAAVQ